MNNYFVFVVVRFVGQTLRNRYGAGTGQIWLDDLHCTGAETFIGNCRHRGWGIHNCGHHEDVSIRCSSTLLTTTTNRPTTTTITTTTTSPSRRGTVTDYYALNNNLTFYPPLFAAWLHVTLHVCCWSWRKYFFRISVRQCLVIDCAKSRFDIFSQSCNFPTC